MQRGQLAPSRLEALDETLKSKQLDDGLARIKIWNRSGRRHLLRQAGPDREPVQAVPEPATSALQGKTVASVTTLNSRGGRLTGKNVGKVLEVYVPLEQSTTRRPSARSTSSSRTSRSRTRSSHETRTLYVLLLAGIGLVWLILFRIVAGASRRLRQQADELELHADEKEYQALHDPLTELPNRALFSERIQYALYDAHDEGREVAVLLMDLDRFKEINDTLGHHCGDLLLQELGVAAEDGAARVGHGRPPRRRRVRRSCSRRSPTGASSTRSSSASARRSRSPSTSRGCRSRSRRRSASASTRITPTTSTRSCSAPTSPCTRPSRRTRCSRSTTSSRTSTTRAA